MPQIRDYTAPVDTLRPSETGVDALAQAGRRVGAFYDQAANSIRQSAQDQARAAFAEAQGKEERAKAAGDVGRSFAELGNQAEASYAHHEIASGAAAYAQLHSDLTDAWNDTAKNADPNDTSIAGKFHEQTLEPKLEQFRAAFNTPQGQQWAESHIEDLRNHMFEKTSADMSTLAGVAVKTNVEKLTNSMTNTARNDGSSVPFLLDKADSSIDGIVSSAPNLKGADSARVRMEVSQKAKEDIVRAGALGVAEKTGGSDAAMSTYVQRYSQYIKPGEADQLTKMAKAYRTADVADYERNRRLVRDQQEDASAAARDNKYIPDITGDNPTFTNKDILNAKDLTWDHKKELLGVLKTEGKDQDSDPQVLRSLVRGAFDPDNPTTESDVLRAKADGKISDKDFTKTYQFVKLSQDAAVDTPTYKETIRSTEKLFGTGPIGTERHAQFMQDFLPQYLKAKREGNAAGALDTQNPNSLISKVMADHMLSEADKMRDRVMRSIGLDPGNAFGPGTTVTGVKVEEAPAKPKPPPLPAWIANNPELSKDKWQYNDKTQQIRNSSGKIYTMDGRPVNSSEPYIPMSR